MATSASAVFDLFSVLVDDYQLDAIFSNSGSQAFNNYLEAWLLFSVDNFNDVRTTNLVYTEASQTFSTDLTRKEQLILSQVMVRYWLQKQVQNVLQMRNVVQDKDFKRHSAAMNLQQKKDLYALKVEEVQQLLQDYEYQNNDWSNWKAQNYDVT